MLATSLLAATPALAQLTTATIRGQVTTSAPRRRRARWSRRATSTPAPSPARPPAPDGSYVLTGLRPGTYDISVPPPDGAARHPAGDHLGRPDGDPRSRHRGAGRSAGDEAAAAPRDRATSSSSAPALVETRTSEVGTNVTDDQIENLPQNNRNFLNFAALAPGIRVHQTEFRQTFGGGGVGVDRDGDSFGGPQVNVFIDGVSLRSNVNQGGIVGQDVSRGNPFSQLAVAEFRVLTSNFKAEYEDAGTSIITAITRSGTNHSTASCSATYQNEGMIARDFFVKRDSATSDSEPSSATSMAPRSAGRSSRDNLFFFASYEGNIQDRANTVIPGGTPAGQALSRSTSTRFRRQLRQPVPRASRLRQS